MSFFSTWTYLVALVTTTTFIITTVESANILFLLPFATKSHKNIFDPLVLALAKRNHNVTIVTPLKFAKPVPNVHEIVAIPFEEINPSTTFGNPFEKRKDGKLGFFLNWNSTFVEVGCKLLYQNEEIQHLLRQGPGSFDLAIVNLFMNGCTLGIIHTLQVPHMYVITMPAMNAFVEKTGLYLPPSFVPNSFSTFTDTMNFQERVLNFLAEYALIAAGHLISNKLLSRMYQEHLGDHLPTIFEIDRNVSMILMNSHFTLTYPRPLLPDVVEVGGLHTRPAKPLPKDLEEFLSGAKNGFIYFSLGSIASAKDMPREMQSKFLKVFSRLNQRVIWKWDGEVPVDLPSNVKRVKWLPQQDILGHPNIKLFMTHGGLLSTQEAVYHGVPLLGLPLFADQDLNMAQAERAGFAKTLEIDELNEDTLYETIHQILTDKIISERAKELSFIFRDQPHHPLETSVYWVEYIIRHKGAKHLRSGGRKLSYIAYHSIDVVFFLVSVLVIALWIIKKSLGFLLKLILRRGSHHDQTDLRRKKNR